MASRCFVATTLNILRNFWLYPSWCICFRPNAKAFPWTSGERYNEEGPICWLVFKWSLRTTWPLYQRVEDPHPKDWYRVQICGSCSAEAPKCVRKAGWHYRLYREWRSICSFSTVNPCSYLGPLDLWSGKWFCCDWSQIENTSWRILQSRCYTN